MCRINEAFTIIQDGEYYMAISMNNSKMIRFNEDGKYLWDEFSKGTSTDELAKKLVEQYDIGLDDAFKQIDRFSQILADNGLIL